MSFEFSTDFDRDTYITLTSLVKHNDGKFKSYKQAKFLVDRFSRIYTNMGWSTETAKTYFNVSMTEGQVLVQVQAYAQWANYGARSIRPVTWMFVVDQAGVVAQYKLGYMGDLRSGTSVDVNKTQLMWQRTGEAQPIEAPVAQETETVVSSHVGEVGKRMVFNGKVKSVTTFNRRKFHYHDSGVGYITRLVVDGNEVIYFGDFGTNYPKGSDITVVATVKEHGEYNGVKQTVIMRPVVK